MLKIKKVSSMNNWYLALKVIPISTINKFMYTGKYKYLYGIPTIKTQKMEKLNFKNYKKLLSKIIKKNKN